MVESTKPGEGGNEDQPSPDREVPSTTVKLSVGEIPEIRTGCPVMNSAINGYYEWTKWWHYQEKLGNP